MLSINVASSFVHITCSPAFTDSMHFFTSGEMSRGHTLDTVTDLAFDFDTRTNDLYSSTIDDDDGKTSVDGLTC